MKLKFVNSVITSVFTKVIVLLCCTAMSIAAQDFGFGGASGEESAETGENEGGNAILNSVSPAVKFSLGGFITAAPLFFVQDYQYETEGVWNDKEIINENSSTDDTYHWLKQFKADGVLQARLNFTASSKWADGILNINIVPTFGKTAPTPIDNPAAPLNIDEGYVRGYLGFFTLEAGLRKLTWGKADSMGVLDVTNSYDYNDFSKIENTLEIKMARPMLHGTFSIGNWTSIELLFEPWFEPNHYATTGRWAPYKTMQGYIDKINAGATVNMPSSFTIPQLLVLNAYREQMSVGNAAELFADVNNVNVLTLKQQYGFRLNTTLGPVDLGWQYFCGVLPNPSITFNDGFWTDTNIIPVILDSSPTPNIPLSLAASTWGQLVNISYDRYHMAGVDYAQVLLGFNLRAEFAATFPFYQDSVFDMDGTRPDLHNPFLGWSFGFDRTVAGIMFNFQVVETIRLFNSGITLPYDIEYGTDPTATRFTVIVSRGFLQDKLNLQANMISDLEDKDFFLIPSVSYTFGDLVLELSAGWFGSYDGSTNGQLSQFYKDNYVKLGVTYNF